MGRKEIGLVPMCALINYKDGTKCIFDFWISGLQSEGKVYVEQGNDVRCRAFELP